MVEAGCDIVWLPMPTLGGTCMSKKHYVELCLPYNKQFIEKIRKTGAKIILHTCGNWNDRFDVASKEGADALHVSEADLETLKKEYGKKNCVDGASTCCVYNADEICGRSISGKFATVSDGSRGRRIYPECRLWPPGEYSAGKYAGNDKSSERSRKNTWR